MNLSNLAIDRSTTVYVLLLLVVIAGVYSYVTLPRESNPEVVIPVVLVTTTYEGVAPSDIETLVTVPIERELTGIAGIKQLVSNSAEGVSAIQVEFEPDVDIDTALQKVRDKVDQARRDLPEAAEDPAIEELNVSEFPIMFLSLTGDVGMPLLTQLAENLEDELEAIRGVLEVDVVGGVEREIQIIVDPDLAGEYGISMADLVQLAQVENVNTPAGSMELGEAKYLVRVPGEFHSAAEIEDLIVKAGPEGAVYIRDIARVVDGFKDINTISRLNGVPAVTLTVSKRGGANVIEVAKAVHDTAEAFQAQALAGVTVHVTMDESEQIRDMVDELLNSILSGLILVLLVIFMFLGLANAVFVALAIPISMLITFVVLYAMGTTLNMVVLFSLILALGMLVDNGIVVVENIHRHLQGDGDPVRSARSGTAEVAWPVISSTLTTVAAFAPMFFWPGIWGKFMVFLPETLTISLLASLFVGLIVNPALAARLMRRKPEQTVRAVQKMHVVLRFYGAVLRVCLRWRLPVIGLAFTSLIIITALFFSTAKIEFVPETEPYRAFIDIDAPEGTRLEETDRIVKEVERRVGEFSGEVDYIIANVGSRGVSAMGGSPSGGGGNSHIGRVTLDFPKLADATTKPSEIVRALRHRFEDIAGAQVRINVEEQGPPAKPPVNVELSGDDFGLLAQLAQRVVGIVENVPNAVDVRDDYEKGKPEIQVRVDRQQALLTGLNTRFIGETVQAAIQGRKAGDYREGDEEYDVTVRFPQAFREDVAKLSSLTMVNLQGQPVPFSAVASLEQGAGLGVVLRIDRKRTVTVSAEVENRTGKEVLDDVKLALKDFALPPGYTIAFTGENEDMEETEAFLGRAFVVAVFLIALVLVSQFNSLVQPFIILTSVLLSLAGVFLGLYVYNMSFGVLMTGIGCISLAGVVVNNAIVLLDFINQLRAQGVSTNEAVVQAGMTRFRPVMLTAVTTVLGLVPMAQGISYDFFKWKWVVGGESSQWWGPMAVAVMFGLSFATLLTLIVVPVLYSLLYAWQDKSHTPASTP